MSKKDYLKKLSDAGLCLEVRTQIQKKDPATFGIMLGFNPKGAHIRISEIENGRTNMSVPVRKLCLYYGGVII